jgi:uncharacterized membrane protein YqjE
MISFGSPASRLTSPGAAPRVIVEALVHRGELAALELKEAHAYGVRTAVMTGASAGLLLLGGFAGTFALAAAVWDRPDRGMILSLATLAYLLASGAFAFVASRRLRDWQPFTETTRQFHADCACIKELVTSAKR